MTTGERILLYLQLISMWREISLAFVVAVIGGTILSVIEVEAQSTVDDSASCESSTLDEAVNLIREDLKNYVRSNEQQSNDSCVSKRDFEDLKAACASNQRSNESYVSKEAFEELKTACSSSRQQSSTVNASSSCEYRACLNVFPDNCS